MTPEQSTLLIGPLVGDAPVGWYLTGQWGEGFAYQQRKGGLRVLIDHAIKADGRRWIHVSVSRKERTPSHEDMALVKSTFIGDHRYAYSVWAPVAVHVNIHPYCLHIWALMDESSDGAVLPEFSDIVDGVGRSI